MLACCLPPNSSSAAALLISVMLPQTLDSSSNILNGDLKVSSSTMMSTFCPVNARISFLSLEVLSAIPSVASPASSKSTFAPRIRKLSVFRELPTFIGSWITELAAVIKATDSSIVLPASLSADAERCIASPIPAELIAKLFEVWLNRSTMSMLSFTSIPNAFMVEITD